MAPKKAAKKAAKKSAKKAVGSHDHRAANDARRTFEHLGRVRAVAALASDEQETLRLLTSTADAAFQVQSWREAADLLRAAEHISFATIVAVNTSDLSEDMRAAIEEEFERLRERAVDHGEAKQAPKALRQVYTRLAKDAASAMGQGKYHRALELARGAEALTHIDGVDRETLTAGKPAKRPHRLP